MDLRAWLVPVALATAALSAWAFGGCTADLTEDCTSGPCGGATIAAATTDAAESASSAGGGGAPACLFTTTNEIPCAVFAILDERCHKCHQNPPLNNAPFPLLTWDDFQADYGSTTVWQHADKAINPGNIPQMPYLEDPLPEAQRDVLHAWFATCTPGPCAKEPEGSGGSGGGGAGGGTGGGATADGGGGAAPSGTGGTGG